MLVYESKADRFGPKKSKVSESSTKLLEWYRGPPAQDFRQRLHGTADQEHARQSALLCYLGRSAKKGLAGVEHKGKTAKESFCIRFAKWNGSVTFAIG
ncbi:MAG: hypothetical protein WBW81_14390 [Methylocella sp.]